MYVCDCTGQFEDNRTLILHVLNGLLHNKHACVCIFTCHFFRTRRLENHYPVPVRYWPGFWTTCVMRSGDFASYLELKNNYKQLNVVFSSLSSIKLRFSLQNFVLPWILISPRLQYFYYEFCSVVSQESGHECVFYRIKWTSRVEKFSLRFLISMLQLKNCAKQARYLTTMTIQQAKQVWKKADAVCFDVDSTVIMDEGIDELAAFCGRGEEVSQW